MSKLVRPHNLTLLLAAVAASLSLLALTSLLVYRTSVSQELKDQSLANCESIETLKAAIRMGLIDQRDTVLHRTSGTDPSVEAATRAYYQRAIARYAPTEC